uniref:Spindle and centriole-associated protein 1 n=1 Tax=Biomphalaria glabrata TaxID=6526 RepID=A0A2C9LCX3_BIOGL
MSFHKVGYNPTKKITKTKKRPAWDDTVNDLTVLRATPEEVLLRKEAHKSKNHLSVKLEKLQQERKSKSQLTGVEAHQLAIIKEVLYDQQQLQNVLAKSDSMMAVVKDLFGDDPKRFMGFPNVTTAPSNQDSNSSSSLVASIPDIYTRSEKLSDSVMDQSALNDLYSCSESDSDDSEIARPKPISYESKLNLQRFQEYLQQEENKSALMDPAVVGPQFNRNQSNRNTTQPANALPAKDDRMGVTQSQFYEAVTALLAQEQRGLNAKDLHRAAGITANKERDVFQTPPRNGQTPPLPSERSPPSAMNDTQKVKKTKQCTSTTAFEPGNTTTNMNDMRKALNDLEKDIASYEQLAGRRESQELKKTETFSGYTIALVTAVSRLTKYLKETELRIQTEATLREQLSQDVNQLKTIIDALATDMIVTQEDYGKLYSDYQQYKEATQNELLYLNNQVRNLQNSLGIKEYRSVQGERNAFNSEERLNCQLSQQEERQDTLYANSNNNNSRKSDDSRTSTPLRKDAIFETNNSVSQPIHSESFQRPTLPATAILLSPPVRKTRIPFDLEGSQLPGTTVSSKRQSSLVEVYHSSTGDSYDPSRDPPHLTQVPPITSTINVPRPIPLVQSNVSVPLVVARNHIPPVAGQVKGDSQNDTISKTLPISDLADLVRLEDETEQQMQQLQELVMEEALNNPDLQNLMQAQIAELNRQQEEAKRRLIDLLHHQKLQQKHIQEKFDPHLHEQKISSSVSPPISPIPQQPEEPERLKMHSDKPIQQTRQVKVSLPQAQFDESA